MHTLERLGRNSESSPVLEALGIPDRKSAVRYLDDRRFHDWLRLTPACRLYLATLAINECKDEYPPSPAYSLGRHMVLWGDETRTGQKRRELENERDEHSRRDFVETLWLPKNERAVPYSATTAIAAGAIHTVPQGKAGEALKITKKLGQKLRIPLQTSTARTNSEEIGAENAQAVHILRRVFLILQSGLQIYDETQNRHIAYREGDVARALNHGGRVMIRIPALTREEPKEAAHSLADWLGITRDGGRPIGGAVFPRAFGTHHTKIKASPGRQLDEIFEEGEAGAAVRNFRQGIRLYGVNLAVGGIGTLDFNGDVVLPDGAHGHLFLGFTPPSHQRDGALQIGIETTGPGAPSTVGYVHGPQSSEATANPESSTFGHKTDKIGAGSPRKITLGHSLQPGFLHRLPFERFRPKPKPTWQSTNARYVDLAVGWRHSLETLRETWESILERQGQEQALRLLVGPHQDFWRAVHDTFRRSEDL